MGEDRASILYHIIIFPREGGGELTWLGAAQPQLVLGNTDCVGMNLSKNINQIISNISYNV